MILSEVKRICALIANGDASTKTRGGGKVLVLENMYL